jgi:hypothetical protein
MWVTQPKDLQENLFSCSGEVFPLDRGLLMGDPKTKLGWNNLKGEAYGIEGLFRIHQ